MHAEERETKIQSVKLLGPAKEMAERKVAWATHLTAHLRNAVIISQRTHASSIPSASLRRRPLLFPTHHSSP
jgi:hypothetical protein